MGPDGRQYLYAENVPPAQSMAPGTAIPQPPLETAPEPQGGAGAVEHVEAEPVSVNPALIEHQKKSPEEKKALGRALELFFKVVFPVLRRDRKAGIPPKETAEGMRGKIFANRFKRQPRTVKKEFFYLTKIGFPAVVETYGDFIEKQIEMGKISNPAIVKEWREATDDPRAHKWYSALMDAAYEILMKDWVANPKTRKHYQDVDIRGPEHA